MAKADKTANQPVEDATSREDASMAGGKTDPGKSGDASDADIARMCQGGWNRNQVPC